MLVLHEERRDDARAVARVDAGFLDVLHDAADDDGAGGIHHGVDVELEGVFQEPIDQHRAVVRHVDGAAHVAVERLRVVHDGHAAAAEHVGRTHDDGIPDALGHLPRLVARHGRATFGLRNPEVPEQAREALAILGQVDRVRRRPEDLHARFEQRQRELQRRLPAELHDARDLGAALPFLLDDCHDVLERQRLEIEAVSGVVVGRDRLRVAVDHHRLETLLAEAEHGVAAAVVELDALADAIRPAAQDDHLLRGGRIGLADLLVRPVHVGRERLELGRARIDALVGRQQPFFLAALPDEAFADAEHGRDVRITEARPLERAQHVRGHRAELAQAGHLPQLDDLGELRQEPRVHVCQLVQLLHRIATLERAEERPHAAVVRHHEPRAQRRVVLCVAGAVVRP